MEGWGMGKVGGGRKGGRVVDRKKRGVTKKEIKMKSRWEKSPSFTGCFTK